MFKLAIKSTVKRLYPNYANVEWTVNKEAIAYDRSVKIDILNSLSNAEIVILTRFFKTNPKIMNLLRLQIKDGVIIPVMTEYPDEIMGTINKPVA